MIPFNRPSAIGKELNYVQAAIQGGKLCGDGPFTSKCHELLEKELGVKKVLLTTSCTAALEMAALLLDIQSGDEVIIPSFTFVSAANAFVLRGATPVFADIRPDTLNLDEAKIERHLTSKTKAIAVMHYAGVGCEMNSILELAERHSIPIIEDNAHGLFAKYKGRLLGTFGCMATQSFHETKNFTCGEGGALLINDERLIARAEIIREKGTNRARFFRGQVDKYTWVDLGSSYLPSDMLAAFLYAQLEARNEIQSKREHIWRFYYEHLWEWADRCEVQLPTVPDHVQHPSHLFYMIMRTPEERDGLIGHLRRAGIQSVFHYLPLHLSVMGRSFGGKEGDCPVTERISERLIRLPFYNELSDSDLAQVVQTVRKFETKPEGGLLAKNERRIKEPSL
jgi:dTDP-4-amino-4,6-dideoxygalactose transaminase